MVTWLRIIRIAGLIAVALGALIAVGGNAYAQVIPSSGPAAGGTSVTISGNGFSNGDVVQVGAVDVLGACLGGTAATNVTVVDFPDHYGEGAGGQRGRGKRVGVHHPWWRRIATWHLHLSVGAHSKLGQP